MVLGGVGELQVLLVDRLSPGKVLTFGSYTALQVQVQMDIDYNGFRQMPQIGHTSIIEMPAIQSEYKDTKVYREGLWSYTHSTGTNNLRSNNTMAVSGEMSHCNSMWQVTYKKCRH